MKSFVYLLIVWGALWLLLDYFYGNKAVLKLANSLWGYYA